MSARIAPEAIAPALPVAEYRLPAVPVGEVEALAETKVQIRKNPYMEAAKVSGAVSGAVEGIAEHNSPEPAPVEPPTEQPGAAYVRAVISGALSPRPTTAQELFARTGTGWVPPESEYRLADKTA